MTYSQRMPNVDELGWGEGLRGNVGSVIDSQKGGFNTWANNASRPWQDGVTTKEEYVHYTGYNAQTGSFERWSGAPLNRWVQVALTKRPERKQGIGTISSLGPNISVNGGTFEGIENYATIYTDVGQSVITKESDSLLIGSGFNTPFTGEGTITTTANSNVATMSINPTTAGYEVGDFLNAPVGGGGGASGYITAINGNNITMSLNSRYGGTYTYQIRKRIENIPYEYENPTVNALNSSGENAFSVAATGDIRAGRSIYGTTIVGRNTTGPAGSFSTSRIVETGNTVGSLSAVSVANFRYLEGSGNEGTINSIFGLNTSVGFIGNASSSSTNTNQYGVNIGIYSEHGNVTNSYALRIVRLGNEGNIANEWGIHEQCGANAKNYLRSNTGINIVNPSERLHVAGNILATGTITPGSDKRWKKDIVKLNNALESIHSIEGKLYYWNDEEQETRGKERQIGLIAQEVYEVCKEAVKIDNEGFMSLNYNGLGALYVEAIKELDSKVQAKEEKIQQLEESLIQQGQLIKELNNKVQQLINK